MLQKSLTTTKNQAGDQVYAKNVQTGEQDVKEVKTVYRNETDTLVHLTIAGEEIIITKSHPFYTESEGWVEAEELTTEDKVLGSDNESLEVEAVEIEELDSPVTVYNFEVEDYHTYYVGDEEILVHNSCTPPTGNKGASGAEEQGKTDNKGDAEAEQTRKEGRPRSNHKTVEGETSLPAKGEPNSSADLLNPDGSIKQRRYYDSEGKAQTDIDYNHSDDGTHEFPHTHEWDWNQNPPRQK